MAEPKSNRSFTFSEEELEAQRKGYNRTNHLLVIGINDYEAKKIPDLSNAVRDARKLVKILTEQYNFQSENVSELFNQKATRRNILKKIKNIAQKGTEDDNLIIFFAGHGYHDDHTKRAFWVPFDAEGDDETSFVPYSDVYAQFKFTKAHHVVIIADACYAGSDMSEMRSLNTRAFELHKSRWLLASGRKEKVDDGPLGEHSPFAKYLFSILGKNPPNQFLRIGTIVDGLKTIVNRNTDQTPVGKPLKNVGDEDGEFIFYPQNWINGATANKKVVTNRTETTEGKNSKIITINYSNTKSWIPEMVEIERGSFRMGRMETQNLITRRRGKDKTVKSFFLGKTPVTVAQYRLFCEKTNSKFPSEQPSWKLQDDHPIIYVSWYNAKVYCAWLSEETGQMWSLPTEEEWEYAARGGKYNNNYLYAGSNNINEVAWYNNNSKKCTHAIAELAPNKLGLYDMSGNVWEWCEDKYFKKETPRTIRGGSWKAGRSHCHVAKRSYKQPEAKRNEIGFRVAIQI